MDPSVVELLREIAPSVVERQSLVVLTGAGMSAASGIPTFRGKEGYWTVGSKEYHPQEMATQRAFVEMPEEVWRWYLYRRAVCRAAKPNSAHYAIARAEAALGDAFLLATQNVDGLHLRAGSTLPRTYQIHGNVDFMRCANACSVEIFPMEPELIHEDRNTPLADGVMDRLRCPHCDGLARPHVLWFDEYYDEALYHFDSSIRAAGGARLLLVVGTSGTTNLPMQMGTIALRQGAAVLDINPSSNPFSAMAQQAARGAWIQGEVGEVMDEIVDVLVTGWADG